MSTEKPVANAARTPIGGLTYVCAHCRRPIVGEPAVLGGQAEPYHGACAASPYASPTLTPEDVRRIAVKRARRMKSRAAIPLSVSELADQIEAAIIEALGGKNG